MKLSKLIAAGLMLAAFAIAPIAGMAQDRHQDRKDIRHDERKLAYNEAQRNRAIKNGHPKVAAHDEAKVQADKRDLHHDRKDLRHDRRK
jgi:hypothetical protein